MHGFDVGERTVQFALVLPAAQKGPHAHCVLFTPDNHFLLLADLGLDKIFIYKFDAAAGKLTANDPAFGSVARTRAPLSMR